MNNNRSSEEQARSPAPPHPADKDLSPRAATSQYLLTGSPSSECSRGTL